MRPAASSSNRRLARCQRQAASGAHAHERLHWSCVSARRRGIANLLGRDAACCISILVGRKG
jgi:hypothetical protein